MPYVHTVEPGTKVSLADFDPAHHDGLERERAEAETLILGQELESLQELLFAASQDAVLVVLQGMDTSGKDGTIKRILSYVNVQSCKVAGFKVPTPLELSHDFLWRIHAQTPAKGGMTVFNRSHYEDVLVARVHKLVEKDVWKERYDRINEFERNLAESGTTILKFFLYISKDEQKHRLLDREKDPKKAWKLSVGDWKERELWDKYVEAYEDALTHCSTPHAKWHIVPANHKWFRDLAIVERLVHGLRDLKDDWTKSLEELGKQRLAELAEFRKKQN